MHKEDLYFELHIAPEGDCTLNTNRKFPPKWQYFGEYDAALTFIKKECEKLKKIVDKKAK
jgi:hypothetical protein